MFFARDGRRSMVMRSEGRTVCAGEFFFVLLLRTCLMSGKEKKKHYEEKSDGINNFVTSVLSFFARF